MLSLHLSCWKPIKHCKIVVISSNKNAEDLTRMITPKSTACSLYMSLPYRLLRIQMRSSQFQLLNMTGIAAHSTIFHLESSNSQNLVESRVTLGLLKVNRCHDLPPKMIKLNWVIDLQGFIYCHMSYIVIVYVIHDNILCVCVYACLYIYIFTFIYYVYVYIYIHMHIYT